MSDALAPHRFNTDLLNDPRDRDEAKRAYPTVFDLLYDEDLLIHFNDYDRPADHAKRRSLVSGIVAVGLAVIGLCGTSAEPVLHSILPESAIIATGVPFALLGLAAIAIGLGGVLTAKSKRLWLHNRLIGERLRQFHFQTFVCRLGAIGDASTGATGWADFRERREAWLAQFLLRFRGQVDAEFTAILQYEEDPLWLHPPPRIEEIAAKPPAAELPRQFFDAYRELRIRRQLQYADYKLGRGQTHVGMSLPRQEFVLNVSGLAATILLFVFEFLTVYWISTGGAWRLSTMLAIWSAIIALAVRTLEEGLQPKREIERYRRYHIAVQDILKRFDAAASDATRFAIMIEMERVSFAEMRDFLRSANEARFIM